MSKIGKKRITIPDGVTITVNEGVVQVAGSKGSLHVSLPQAITVSLQDGELAVARASDEKQARAFHGLVRSLVQNAVIGVSQGYKKTLKLVGTGYRVQSQGANLSLAVGYSHPIVFEPPAGVSLSTEGTDTIHIEGIDKQVVGQVTANIRELKPPEPYKGKGIRYSDEVVRRKQGKTVA